MAGFWEQQKRKKEKKTHGKYVPVQLTSPFSICSTMLPNSVISSESDIVNIPINRDGCTKGVYRRPREDSLLLRNKIAAKPSSSSGVRFSLPGYTRHETGASRILCDVPHQQHPVCNWRASRERAIMWHWSLAPSEGNLNKPLGSSLKHKTPPFSVSWWAWLHSRCRVVVLCTALT